MSATNRQHQSALPHPSSSAGRFPKRLLLVVPLLLALVALPLLNALQPIPAYAAGTIYVNAAATGTNDGTSWANAYASLQDTILNTSSGDEIRVAA